MLFPQFFIINHSLILLIVQYYSSFTLSHFIYPLNAYTINYKFEIPINFSNYFPPLLAYLILFSSPSTLCIYPLFHDMLPHLLMTLHNSFPINLVPPKPIIANVRFHLTQSHACLGDWQYS